MIQAENGIRDFSQSRGLGDVYKIQEYSSSLTGSHHSLRVPSPGTYTCLLYTTDDADDPHRVDLGCSRLIKKTQVYDKHCIIT